MTTVCFIGFAADIITSFPKTRYETILALRVVGEPASVAQEISRRLAIPTIGIGSGRHCDGEIQVFHDVFGLHTDFQPRHTRRYLNVAQDITSAARQYVRDVCAGVFPGAEQTSDLGAEAKEHFRALLTT